MSGGRVLVADDEERMALAIARALGRDGHQVKICADGEQALALCGSESFDVVVSDRRMPGMDGLELLRRLREEHPELPVILVTAYAEVRSAVAAMREGAFDYLAKPFDNHELRTLVGRALELRRLTRENRALRRALAEDRGGMVAESAAGRRLLELLDRIAPAESTVLIQGESGTGKELVARRIHHLSPRAAGPFVAVNCKAFSESVLESELFGHEKGAFTGAATGREGCFERARGGTLFLDEIGEVSLDFQAKLLRVLQEGEVQRVGGDRPRSVDARVVAATNRVLRDEIEAGRFREDLYFRLRVLPVELEPLRSRREDILPLARHFLARFASEGGLAFSSEAELALVAHGWPGNVRELRNAVERAVVLAREERITAEDLLLEDGGMEEASTLGEETLEQSLDRAAAERIRGALEQSDGKRAEAARRLGIDRTTLYRWMKRLGCD